MCIHARPCQTSLVPDAWLIGGSPFRNHKPCTAPNEGVEYPSRPRITFFFVKRWQIGEIIQRFHFLYVYIFFTYQLVSWALCCCGHGANVLQLYADVCLWNSPVSFCRWTGSSSFSPRCGRVLETDVNLCCDQGRELKAKLHILPEITFLWKKKERR